jgi:hypothetical protein
MGCSPQRSNLAKSIRSWKPPNMDGSVERIGRGPMAADLCSCRIPAGMHKAHGPERVSKPPGNILDCSHCARVIPGQRPEGWLMRTCLESARWVSYSGFAQAQGSRNVSPPSRLRHPRSLGLLGWSSPARPDRRGRAHTVQQESIQDGLIGQRTIVDVRTRPIDGAQISWPRLPVRVAVHRCSSPAAGCV